MRQLRFYISLYIIIPFIITGLTILACIISFRLTKYTLGQGADPAQPVFWLIIVLGILAFAIGFALVRVILNPVERFVEKALKLASISGDPVKKRKEWSVDKIAEFASVFDRVTSVLSRIDARHFFPEIIGESLAMRGMLSLIKKVAPSDATVLILGESGTGKELVATSIHENSLRKSKPFIKLNCAAIPAELLESELFGHEKGAFTGATKFKPGKFDMADNGTLFLDEIGDMPLKLQSKILRVIQEKEFYRVGGSSTVKVDVRFIASTNQNLEKMVQEGAFREDLYYRLNVFTLHLPPLRERKEDILLLAKAFLSQNLLAEEKKIRDFTLAAITALENYLWPGNIRELKGCIDYAVIKSQNDILDMTDFPPEIVMAIASQETGLFYNFNNIIYFQPGNKS